IFIEDRNAEGNLDRVPALVTELFRLNLDVFVSGNLAAIRAAKKATTATPIVMVVSVDPVATGLIESLAHPGGNITGVTRLTRDLSGKRLELLKEVVPQKPSIGILWDASSIQSGPAVALKEYEAAATLLNLPLQSLEVHSPTPDLEGAFKAAVKGHVSS